MPVGSYTLFLSLLYLLFYQTKYTDASALAPGIRITSDPASPAMLQARQEATPVFPAVPPSCPKCAAFYDSINSCANAAPVLANFSVVIFNPGAFIDVIKCACTDTFQAAYPQCADCFIRTNQTDFLSASSDEVPGIISGIRSVCAISSTLLGNVSTVNSEVPTSASSTSPPPTDSGVLANSAPRHHRGGLDVTFILWTLFLLYLMVSIE